MTMEVRATLARALILALVIALFVIVLQGPLIWLGLRLIEASADVERLADTYISIRIWGAPAALTNYVILGWFLGRQNAKAALALQVFMNGLNIVLDLVFVVGFGWGVEGVATATIIAEYSAAALGLYMIARALGRVGGSWSRAHVVDRARLRRLIGVNGDIFNPYLGAGQCLRILHVARRVAGRYAACRQRGVVEFLHAGVVRPGRLWLMPPRPWSVPLSAQGIRTRSRKWCARPRCGPSSWRACFHWLLVGSAGSSSKC